MMNFILMSTLFWLNLPETPTTLLHPWYPELPSILTKTRTTSATAFNLWSAQSEFAEGGCHERDEIAIEYGVLNYKDIGSKNIQFCCSMWAILSLLAVIFQPWIDALLHLIISWLTSGASKLGESFRKGRPARKCGAQKARKHRRNFNIVCKWSQHC